MLAGKLMVRQRGGAAPSVWDITGATYDNISFDASPEEGTPSDVVFRDNGLQMYVTGETRKEINEYTLTTPWDVSTATYANKLLNISPQINTVASLCVKGTDGTTFYALQTAGTTIFQYTLTTPWDISTGSFAAKTFDFVAQESNGRAFTLKPDGSKLYVLGTTNDTFYQYSLTTPWDISTAVYDNKFFSTTQLAVSRDVDFSSDGLTAYGIGSTADSVFQYNLTTAWDISTASYNGVSISVAAQTTLPKGFDFKTTGSRFFVVDATNGIIYQYSF